MEGFYSVVKTLVICGAALMALFLILLAIPQTKFRSLVLEFLGWTGAAASAVAVISPLDLVPDIVPVAGQIDDVGYLVTGLICAVLAYLQRKGRATKKLN